MSAAARSTDAGALLARTQQQIERLYGIEAPHGAEAFLLADRVGVLHSGRLEQVATPEVLRAAPATTYVRDLLQRARVME